VDGLAVDEVIVVEHEHQPARRGREGVDQRRDHGVARVASGDRESCQRPIAEVDVDSAYRCDDVAPEADRIRVAFVERYPGEWPLLRRRGVPLGE
jgi:hypothetical protein